MTYKKLKARILENFDNLFWNLSWSKRDEIKNFLNEVIKQTYQETLEEVKKTIKENIDAIRLCECSCSWNHEDISKFLCESISKLEEELKVKK